MVHEDDVIAAASASLAGKSCIILAAGANQGAAFRYNVPGRTWKSPDLVALRKRFLIVCEAKINATRLFSASLGSPSDFEALQHLRTTPDKIDALKDEARRRLSAAGVIAPVEMKLLVGTIAGTPFSSSQIGMLARSFVVGISVNVPGGIVECHNIRTSLKRAI